MNSTYFEGGKVHSSQFSCLEILYQAVYGYYNKCMCSYYTRIALVVQFCGVLTDLQFGAVNTTDTLENTVAGYSCIQGFILDGDETRVCQRNADTVTGVWSGAEPTCMSRLYILTNNFCPP